MGCESTAKTRSPPCQQGKKRRRGKLGFKFLGKAVNGLATDDDLGLTYKFILEIADENFGFVLRRMNNWKLLSRKFYQNIQKKTKISLK